MIKKVKKGFTIVELVIVIAVIGVLAAVLIPTFISLNKKADEKADNVLVHNLNTALRVEEAQEGKNATLHDAVLDLEDYGYKLANLVSKGEQKLLWDEEKDEFLLDNGGHNAINFWEIRSSMPGSGNKRSIYAGNGWSVSDVGGTEGISYGFDVGFNSVASVNYKNTSSTAQTVTIRTSGGELTVNAPLDTVHHYSDLDNLSVEAIADESYHEHGKVKVGASVGAGHLVVEEDGFVNELAIPAAATTASVDIKPQGTVVTAVVDNSSATVNVAKGATIEQIVAQDTSKISGEGAAEAKENAVSKTVVTTKAEFDEAFADEENVKYILIDADIDFGTRLTIDRDIIIDGSSSKHTLTFSSENKADGRAINVGFSVPNRTVTLKNLKVVGPTSGGYTRGLNVGQANTRLIVDNCEVSCKYYAMNIISNADNVDITVTNSKFSGWSSINLWASIKIDVSNSELVGTSISKDEGFANICFEADTTKKTSEHVSDAKVTVKNSIIRTEYNYTSGAGYHAMVGYNYAKNVNADHNEFEAINCDLQWAGPNANLLLAYDYCNYGSVTTNVTIVNGKTLDFGTSWYYEK